MGKIRWLILSMMAIVVCSASLPVWACDAMGPNRHVGIVTKIDPQAGTFTIIDAQMEKSLTFAAEKKVLDAVQLNRSFIITFRMDGEQMKAESVVPQSEDDNT